ncbi:hypothetical protein WA026_009286 [Henosepilachna vigintioctopunctata]|uniref:Uncharacterized protein n=1 Tax=Henosepilachna vigintioctopunctata TaxID=420089 RepID=A0AAW1UX23_9CUCU
MKLTYPRFNNFGNRWVVQIAVSHLVKKWKIRPNSEKFGNCKISTEFDSRESLRLTVSGEQSLKIVGTKPFFIRTMELSKFSSLVAQDENSSHYAEIDSALSRCPPVCASELAAACLDYKLFSEYMHRRRRPQQPIRTINRDIR